MSIIWIEIVDTSIKIGLGALLSGVSAYLINKQNHRKTLEKEYVLKHRNILENITQDIENITHVLLRYWSFTLD